MMAVKNVSKIIHSPKMGRVKTTLDYGLSSDEQGVLILSEEDSADKSSTFSTQELQESLEEIERLRLENEKITSEQLSFKTKYDNLISGLERKKNEAKELGYKEGVALAKTEIEQLVNERVVLGETLLNEIKNGILKDVYDQEGICLEIVFSTICRLIGDSAGSKNQVKSILKLTMEKIANKENLEIYLSETDYKTLKDDAFVVHDVIKSDELQYGGCIIKTGKGTVEAKLDDQLDKLKLLLLNIHSNK